MRLPLIAVLFFIVGLVVHGEDIDDIDDAKPLTDRRRNKASDKKDVSLKRKTVLGDDEVEEVGDTMWSFLEQKHPLSDFTASGRTRQRSSSQSTQNWNNDDWSKSFDDENEVEQKKGFSSFGFDNQHTSNNRQTCTSMIDTKYPIFSDTCGAVPQARYSLPNLFGHRDRWQVAQFLQGMVSATDDQTCLRSLKLLLCPMVFPACSNSRTPATPVLPCQSFCRAVKNQCSIAALDVFPCENLPQTSDLCPSTQGFASLMSPTTFPSRSQQASWNVAPQTVPNQWSLLSMLPSVSSTNLPLNQLHLSQPQKSDDTATWWSTQAEQLLNPSLTSLHLNQNNKLDELARWQQKEQTQRLSSNPLHTAQQKQEDLTLRQPVTEQVQRTTLAQLLQAKPEDLVRWQTLNPTQQTQQQGTVDPRQIALFQGQNLAQQLQNPSLNRPQWNFIRQ